MLLLNSSNSCIRSRLFIKGLPYSLNDQGLQQYFQESGFEVTDAKVMHRSDGSSRGFGFVGLKDEGDAGKAREQLHQSFLHGSRLNVALAREVRSGSAPYSLSSLVLC